MEFDESSISPEQDLPDIELEALPAALMDYVENWEGTFPLRRLVKAFAACFRIPSAWYGETEALATILDQIAEEAQCAILDDSLPSPAEMPPFPVRPVDYAYWLFLNFRPITPRRGGQPIELLASKLNVELFKYFAILKKREMANKLAGNSELAEDGKQGEAGQTKKTITIKQARIRLEHADKGYDYESAKSPIYRAIKDGSLKKVGNDLDEVSFSEWLEKKDKKQERDPDYY